eukprot:Skav201774  [mRNA]  locus=scaffold2375:36193:36844:+ [translate_table: standard]
MKLREPATHPATTLMPLTQFVEAAAINLAPLKVMVRMLLITSEQAASRPLFAGQRLRAMSANGGIRARNQKLSAMFHAQKACSIGGIEPSWSSLAAKLEEFARSRRSAASKVLTPP